MDMLKDCPGGGGNNINSHLSHELVPITPLAESLPINSPLLATMDHQHLLHQYQMQQQHSIPMLLPLSHQMQQQSQLVPIQIQQTQPPIMASSSALAPTTPTTTTNVVVCVDPTGMLMTSEQQLVQQDAQQPTLIPMADPSNGGCLTCLPELPETEDCEEEEGVAGCGAQMVCGSPSH